MLQMCFTAADMAYEFTSTVALAIIATVSRLLPRNAKIKAAAKPSVKRWRCRWQRIAGKVMAESVAYGT